LGVCCDQGTQTLLSTPGPCTLTPTPTGFHFQWPAPPYASGDGYRVYRNGSLIQEVTSGTLSINDDPGPGSYTYCVNAFKNNYPDSAPCCQSGTFSGPSSAPEPCLASEDRAASILLTWTDVQGEDGYQILRDNVLIHEVPKDTTHFLDRGVLGGHTYCVRGFNGSGRTPDCCSHGTALAPAARTRLSWNTCSPQVYDQSFQGPGTYTLLLSVTGVPLSNVGHDCQLRIRPKVPDAWRFDDGGCQTEARLDLRVQGNGPGCPAMLGANPLTITSYFLDLDGSARLRLAVTYDSLSTDTTTRYVLWKISFDHTHSVVGSDTDSTTCNGADVPLDFDLEFAQILGEGNRAWDAPLDPKDMPVVWNGGQVRVQPVTWGRVKALYR